MKQRVERRIGDSVLAIETGFLAKQAAGSVLVSYGETVVLVASATGALVPGSTFSRSPATTASESPPPASFRAASSSVKAGRR